MALIALEKIQIRGVLGVTKAAVARLGVEDPYTKLEQVMAALTDDEITEVRAILDQYQEVKFSTGTLKGEYNQDPADSRKLCKKHLINALNFNPADYGIGPSFEVERG